jgi:two-component system sensor histidine kinase SenX3
MCFLFGSVQRRRKRAARRLGTLIARKRGDIERRWFARVCNDLGAANKGEPSELRDGMPDYLEALADTLRKEGNFVHGVELAWSNMAREHGVTRVQLGFDINQLVHEFVVLRRVIREVAHEAGLRAWTPDTVLTDALDAAISESVQAYVHARDYETRRQQAETIGFLTHELRTPLSAAVMAASTVRRTATPEQQRALEALERSHQRLKALIDSVLLNEKLDAGKFHSRPVDAGLGELIEPAIETARATAQRKGLEFRVTYDRGLRMRLDPGLTRSVVENLVDNAVKYTEHGWIDLSVEDLPDAIVLHVRDTCHGLSPEELRTIFEPFRRGRTQQSGTGLGLAIARRAVETQGGTIHAESPEQHGCHFWVRLPKHANGS